MTSDHHAEACRGRVHVHLIDIMQHVNPDTLKLERQPRRELDTPGVFVIVAADHIDRRNSVQRIDHARAADVARVDDTVHPCQRSKRLRPDQAVRIGYEPDSHRNPSI